jgi:hypothetical protein
MEDVKDIASRMLSSLTPDQQLDLADRLKKAASPPEPSESRWQEGDYIAFRVRREWRVGRVKKLVRECSETVSAEVEESDGSGGTLRPWCTTILLERVPPGEDLTCDSYFHGKPRAKLKPEDEHFVCFECKDKIEITPEIRKKDVEYWKGIRERVKSRV